MSGPKEQISSLKQQVGKPFTKVHDHWNMETSKMELKEFSYSNPVFAFHNIYNHLDDGVSDEVYQSQPDHSKNPLDFSGNDWYNWNIRNWGTKWDVAVSNDEKYSDTELMEETKNSLAYRFNTAWSPPTEIIAKLSEQYPNLVFTLSYEEETGWGGETVFEGGEGSDTESYGWKCRECDHIEDETPYCEECEFDTCPDCGYNESDEPCNEHLDGKQ
jgi:hypothetical protein